jgi:hypothetical protein
MIIEHAAGRRGWIIRRETADVDLRSALLHISQPNHSLRMKLHSSKRSNQPTISIIQSGSDSETLVQPLPPKLAITHYISFHKSIPYDLVMSINVRSIGGPS